MLCFHYNKMPEDIARLTLIQYNMLIRAMNDHFEREAKG